MVDGDRERTRLANERTYLAWWRTGIAALAAGFAVGRIVPEVVSGTTWPYVALGTTLAVAGLLAMVFGVLHYRALRRALDGGGDPPSSDAVVLVLAIAGIVVGVASVVLVLLAP